MATPIHELDRSYGDFPREHSFSTLDNLESNLDNPEMEVFFNAAEKLITSWQGDKFAGLYLYGEPGTGKTHAAIGLARALHESGAAIHFRYVPSWRPKERYVASGFSNKLDIIEPHITDWIGPIYNNEDILPLPFPTSRPVEDSIGCSFQAEVHDKSVLILDDFKPFARNYVSTAIEAASQYGGLVVITSNYTDPFKIIEETPQEKQQSAHLDALSEFNPSIVNYTSSLKVEIATRIEALRSRVVAGFKFIHFQGADRRIENSFWSDK